MTRFLITDSSSPIPGSAQTQWGQVVCASHRLRGLHDDSDLVGAVRQLHSAGGLGHLLDGHFGHKEPQSI